MDQRGAQGWQRGCGSAPPSDIEALGSGSAQGETEAVFRGAGSPTNAGSTWGLMADGPGWPGSPGGPPHPRTGQVRDPAPPQGPGASCQSRLGIHGLGLRGALGTTTPHMLTCPPRTAGAVFLTQATKSHIIHKSSRAQQPGSYPSPRQGTAAGPPPTGTHSSGSPVTEPLPHSQPGHGRAWGAAAARLHHCLPPTWRIKPAASRKPQSPGGG